MQIRTWTFARILLACCLMGMVSAIAISFAVRPRYVSQTLIMIDSAMDAAGDPVGGADKNPVNTEIANIADSAFNRGSLAPIIEELNLYPDERARMAPEAVIDQMKKSINIKPVKVGPASEAHRDGVVLSFDYPDPRVAQRVDADLSALLAEANLSRKIASPRDDEPRRRRETFSVIDAATLPQKPTFPNRKLFGAAGLLAGLAGSFILAFIARVRQNRTAAGAG